MGYLLQIALVADTNYFNQKFDDASEAYAFLQRACNEASAANLPKCPSIEERSKQLLSQMLNGVNFYGEIQIPCQLGNCKQQIFLQQITKIYVPCIFKNAPGFIEEGLLELPC